MPHRTTRKFASFLCRRSLCFCCQASEISALGPSWAVMLNLRATDSIRVCICLKVSAESFAAWRCGVEEFVGIVSPSNGCRSSNVQICPPANADLK